jgi:hypothetical protein
MNNMTANNSEQQIDSLAKLYTGIMHGKVAPYDEQYNQLSGAADKHLQNIPESLNKLSQKYGYETPWVKTGMNGQQNQQQAPQTAFQPNDKTQYERVSGDGTAGKGTDGKWYIIATGKPANQ